MPEGTIRIKDQPLDTALSPGDLIIVDSEESGVGTRKFDLGTELTDIKQDLEQISEFEIYVSGTSLVINSNLANGDEVSY